MQFSEVSDKTNQSSMFMKLTEISSEKSSSFSQNTLSKGQESIQELKYTFNKQEFSRCLMYVVKYATQQKEKSSEVSKILEMGIDILNNDISSIKGNPNSNSKSYTSFQKDQLFQQSNNSTYVRNYLVQLREMHSRFLSQQVQLEQLKTIKQKMEKQKNEQISKMKKQIDYLKLNNQQITKKYKIYKQQATELKQKLDRNVSKLNTKIQTLK